MADAAALTVSILGHTTVPAAASATVGALHGIEGAAGRVGGALTSMASTAIKATAAVAAIGAGAVAAGLTASVKAAAGFEQQISAIGAVANLTAEQMKAVSDIALQIGKDTKFGAAEAAAGIEELVKAGVSMDDVMAGAARSTADLAAATGTDLKTAAEVASNAMNVFNKSGADMAEIANTITGATNASAIDINDFRLSLAAAGAVAASVGISFEDLSTGIALMGNAGIKGSDAGTSLKTMLLNLQPSTKAQVAAFRELGIITADGANQFFTAEGKAKSLADIAGVLQEATRDMTDQQKLATLEVMFGTDAIRAATILTKAGAAGFTDLGAKMAGMDAGEQGRRRIDNLAGSMEQLKGTIETTAITIGLRFTPILKRLVDQINAGLGRALPQIERWADRAAAGLDRLIERVTLSAPRIVALGSAVLAFGQSLLPLAQRVLPALADAWERVQGLFGGAGGEVAGGIQGALGSIQGVIAPLIPLFQQIGQALVDNLVSNFRFLTDVVLPPLLSIVQQTGQFLMTTLLPAVAQTGAVMRGIFGETLQWLATTAWPPLLSVLQQTVDLFTRVILPTLPGVANALRTVLGETVQWLATVVWPRLTTAVGAAWRFISGTVVPEIPGLVRDLRTLLGGALTWLADTAWPALVRGATTAWRFLQDNIIPVVRDTVDWLKVRLPEAINTVVSTFESLRGRVQPIVEQAFSGDIIGAIKNLGSAFAEFAVLAAGWLGEQVAAIDWAAVWARATTIAAELGTYVLGLAVDFATWLGQQVAAIPWAHVWTSITGAAEALGTYLLTLVLDFATWLKQEVAKIPWPEVWASITGITEAAQAEFMNRLNQIDWYAAMGDLRRAENDILRWLTDVIRNTDWASLGMEVGTQFVSMFQGKVDWSAIGVAVTERLGAMLGLAIASGEAWIEFNKGFLTGITHAITGMDPTEAARAFGAWLGNVLTQGARDAAAAAGTEIGNIIRGMLGLGSGGGGGGGTTTSGGRVRQKNQPTHATPYLSLIEQIAAETGEDPALIAAIVDVEQSGAGSTSPAGAKGLMQTLSNYWRPGEDPHDPATSIRQGVRAIKDKRAILQAQGYEATPEQIAARYFGTGVDAGGMTTEEYRNRFRSRYGNYEVAPAEGGPPSGESPGNPLYVTPIAGMGAAQLHHGSHPGGSDIFAPAGTPIRSIGGGTVTGAGNFGPGGYAVMVRGDDGLEYYYAHMQDAPPVSAGMRVEAGQIIGAVGNTGNAATTPSHLHLGIGERILSGLGPAGGAGSNFNAVQFLNDIREGKYDAGLQQLRENVQTAGDSFTHVNQEAAATTPELSAIGAAVDPVAAAFSEGTVTAGQMTDAIITTAAQQGVGTQTAQQYAAGLITQDQAMRGVLEGFAATTPAAAELLAQLDAGTISTDQAAVAFAGLATSTAESTGAIVGSTEMMKTGALANFDLMAAGSTTATTNMGTQILTTITDTAGNSATTWTDLAGNVVAQTVTMADGTVVATDEMGAAVTSTFDEMAGTVTTTLTDLDGNVVTTVTDMAGAVVEQYVTMAGDAGSAVSDLGETVTGEFGAIASEAEDAVAPVEDFGQALVDIPQADMSDTVRQFGRAADAARAATRRIKELAEATEDLPGGFGGSRGGSIFGKAAGGTVLAGQTYWVGERGPELFYVPRSGTIIPNHAIGTGNDGGTVDTIRFVIAQPDGRTLEEWHVRGRDLAARRGRD